MYSQNGTYLVTIVVLKSGTYNVGVSIGNLAMKCKIFYKKKFIAFLLENQMQQVLGYFFLNSNIVQM